MGNKRNEILWGQEVNLFINIGEKRLSTPLMTLFTAISIF